MKPVTKIIIFLVIAFVIVFIITAMRSGGTSAPATTENEQATTTSEISTTASPSLATDPAYPLSEVAKHKTATDCWTVVGNFVYDLTAFVSKHPGGVEAISQICGVDGTEPFTKMHGSNENAQRTLVSLKIGVLKK